MKKKPDSIKPRQKRHRRSNLELAGFSRDHLKTIKRISDESRVPIEQVFADIIENGLITVMPMYETMIEFRKSRETRLKHLFEPKPTKNEFPFNEATGQGIASDQARLDQQREDTVPDSATSEGDAVSWSPRDFERSDDVVERSGLAAAVNTAFGSDDSNREILGGGGGD